LFFFFVIFYTAASNAKAEPFHVLY